MVYDTLDIYAGSMRQLTIILQLINLRTISQLLFPTVQSDFFLFIQLAVQTKKTSFAILTDKEKPNIIRAKQHQKKNSHVFIHVQD